MITQLVKMFFQIVDCDLLNDYETFAFYDPIMDN